MTEWFVYILRCCDATFYTGITNNLEKRVNNHRAAKGARYTRTRLPLRLVYHEILPSQGDALKREWEIKRWSRARKNALIRASWAKNGKKARRRRNGVLIKTRREKV